MKRNGTFFGLFKHFVAESMKFLPWPSPLGKSWSWCHPFRTSLTSVETIRLLQKQMIFDVWKHLVVFTDIFSLNIPKKFTVLLKYLIYFVLLYYLSVYTMPSKLFLALNKQKIHKKLGYSNFHQFWQLFLVMFSISPNQAIESIKNQFFYHNFITKCPNIH